MCSDFAREIFNVDTMPENKIRVGYAIASELRGEDVQARGFLPGGIQPPCTVASPNSASMVRILESKF
jgi:hypothetical protein